MLRVRSGQTHLNCQKCHCVINTKPHRHIVHIRVLVKAMFSMFLCGLKIRCVCLASAFSPWLNQPIFFIFHSFTATTFFRRMVFIRVFLLAFNVAVLTYLIYRLLQIYRSNTEQKGWKIGIGIFLIVLPATMLMGFVRPSPLYLFLYPVAISLHLYLVRNS